MQQRQRAAIIQSQVELGGGGARGAARPFVRRRRRQTDRVFPSSHLSLLSAVSRLSSLFGGASSVFIYPHHILPYCEL